MRAKKAKKRVLELDPVYKSRLVTRFINYLMIDGKKSLARTITYKVIESLQGENNEGVQKFEEAIKLAMPKMEVRSRRVGGATYQVPTPLRHDRSEALAIKWIIEGARSKKGSPIFSKLLSEITASLKGEGFAIKKRDDVHRMAESNKAFAHFKW